MNKKILSLVLVLAMLLTTLVMVVPTSATTTETVKTKGYLLAVRSETNEDGVSSTANGMSMIFLLADGTFMIYDGGGDFGAQDAAHLKSELQSISTQHGLNPNNIVVSLWMISHPHEDHVGFFKNWSSHMSGITVKEFWYNHTTTVATKDSIYKRIHALYPSTPINAVYPGEQYNFADVHIKILYSLDNRLCSPTFNQENFSGTTGTYTDLYGTTSNGSHADGNNSSTILRMDVGSTSILLTGDAGWKAFEEAYTNFKDDLDVDIFQVSHHGVGSASKPLGDRYSTPNNKHFAAITPTTILIPAGRDVVNMTLDGTRAYIGNDVKQTWNNGSSATSYDGYYQLYREFGIVSAAGANESTTNKYGQPYNQFSASEFSANQSKVGTKSYYIAGQYGVDSNIKNIQQFFEAEDSAICDAEITMLEGAAVRCIEDQDGKGSGIRFISKVSAESIAKLDAWATATGGTYSFGTVVCKAESLRYAGQFTTDVLDVYGEKYVDIPAKDGMHEEDGDLYIFAAVVNIKAKNYRRDFAAVSYIEYKTAEGETYRTYSNFNTTDNVRNIYEVACQALADVEDVQYKVKDLYSYYSPTTEIFTYDEATGKYSVQTVATPKYSRYGAAQRVVLKKYVTSQAHTFGGYEDDDYTGYDDIWS